LIDKILELSSDEARCQQMRTNIGGMGIKDAAVRVATEILRILNNKEPLTKA
jgi:UDP-N-acetylglucosamine:LPS N-acetylglucosamine transferase